MRKHSILALLANCALVLGSINAMCYAAEEAMPKAAASPEAASPQPSQRKMHHLSQQKAQAHPPSHRQMHRMQRAGKPKPRQLDPQGIKPGMGKDAPTPSQRGMRQKMKEARQKTSAVTGSPEPQ